MFLPIFAALISISLIVSVYAQPMPTKQDFADLAIVDKNMNKLKKILDILMSCNEIPIREVTVYTDYCVRINQNLDKHFTQFFNETKDDIDKALWG